MQISQVGYLSYEKRAPWLLLLPVGGEFFHQHGNPGILINRVMFAIESIECSGGFFFHGSVTGEVHQIPWAENSRR